MRRPAAPLLLLLLLPVTPMTLETPLASPCFPVPTDVPAELDLSNRTQGCAELDWSLFQHQRRVVLSHNGIDALNPSARVAPGLQELDLSHNRLRELPPAFLQQAQGLQQLHLQHNRLRRLPDAFFANATALRTLRLEDNPLATVPTSAFQASLRVLAVPCRCDAVGSVLAHCTCSGPDCTQLQCRCHTGHQDFNVTEFHGRQCQGSVGLVAGVAGAAVGVAVLAVVAAVLCYRRRKVATASTGWGKREPSVVQGQPRYISRATEVGTTEAAATTAPDYENVFISPCTAPAATRGWTPGWQEEPVSAQVPVDDDYFLESDAVPGDQPIYANTQNPNEDTIYIVPNQ